MYWIYSVAHQGKGIQKLFKGPFKHKMDLNFIGLLFFCIDEKKKPIHIVFVVLLNVIWHNFVYVSIDSEIV